MVRIKSNLPVFFEEPESTAKAQLLMNALLASISKIDDDLAKKVFLVAVLAATFEFLRHASIGQIVVFGVQFNDLETVEKVIPLIVAYLYFSCWALVASRRIIEEVFDAIAERAFPSLWQGDIEAFLRPPHFIKTYGLITREISGPLKYFVEASVVPILIVLSLSVPVFVVYAIYSIISRYEFDVLCAISATLSAFFVLQVLLLMLAVNRMTSN